MEVCRRRERVVGRGWRVEGREWKVEGERQRIGVFSMTVYAYAY